MRWVDGRPHDTVRLQPDTTYVGVLVAILAAGALAAGQSPSSRQVEWVHYGGDPGGMKYSTLTDINAGNVQRLHVAWEWKHWETPLQEFGTTPGFFERANNFDHAVVEAQAKACKMP